MGLPILKLGGYFFAGEKRCMKIIREKLVLAVGRLLRVPVEIHPVWYGAEPVLKGEDFERALHQFFDAQPPKERRHQHLRLVE